MIQILLKVLAVLGTLIAENRTLKNDIKDLNGTLAAAMATEKARDEAINIAKGEAAAALEAATVSANRAIEAEATVERLKTALSAATYDDLDLDLPGISAQFDALLSTLS